MIKALQHGTSTRRTVSTRSTSASLLTSGFASLEAELLVKGNVSPERVQRFLSLNTRVTTLSAILLLASLACFVL
jgi:hypothetical protein